MKKYLLNLQMFADGAEDAAESGNTAAEAAATAAAQRVGASESAASKDEPKYTDADVDRLIERKFAEWQKKQEKRTSEAERLGRMTAEEKANERMSALESKIRDYETREARTAMTTQARSILNDKGVYVDDALLANLIAEDADSTKASVESFLTLFQGAVEKAVKEAVKGETPRKGAPVSLTKEQILAITNRAERQRLIRENMDLFR